MSRGKKAKKGISSKGANQKASDTFLTINAGKPGIVTTSSGLQYEIVEDIAGVTPSNDSIVTIQQRIKLVDGTVIADTYKTGSPEIFEMSEAIEGYREGLLMMSEGSRYRFFVPPEIAWGNRGAGTKIGPNVVIIIDCRLVSVK